ncbi:MAG: lysine--tRNA ligase [Polyangiaceae bacterium]
MPTEPGHSAEQAIIDARRAKAEALRQRKENPFANDVAKWGNGVDRDDIADVRVAAAEALHDGKYSPEEVAKLGAAWGEVHVCGRVMALRSTGGLSFIRLRDRTGEIQLMLDQSVMQGRYERLSDVDVGDIIEARGALAASKRGELSILPVDLRPLTKAYRPLPEKWHGLTDDETRYRQRYVDLIANPGVADVFRARSHIVRALRAILDDNGFLEVETPTMHTLIGGATARPFVTHHNALDMKLFMRIAPELYLKRLVAGGLERVYEIGRCYRNEGISTRHNPEFTMLEFYQAYATYDDLMSFTELLIRGVDMALERAMPEAHATWKKERPFTLDRPFARVSMSDAVKQAALATKIPAWAAPAADTDPVTATALVKLLRAEFGDSIKEWSKSSPRAKAIDWSNFRKVMQKVDSDGEALFVLYEYLAEPFLSDDYRHGNHSVPVFIKDYPFEVSPLARRSDARPEICDRFELFVQGRELCNAFSELNDPDDQASRFQAQVEKKARGVEETMDYDEDYIRALEYGMPPAAGFGMGIDRLAMALTNAASIRDVILFPLLRPETP